MEQVKKSSMNKNFYINSSVVWKGNAENPLPDISFIPSLIRRRLTDIEKIGLYLANQVCGDKNDYYVVFASRFGEWGQTIKLIEQFYNDREMSPAGFSNSVHNATPGILSVLKHNNYAYTSVAGNDNTIDSALLEAFCSKKNVLFVYAEEKMPEIYAEVCDNKNLFGYGCAFLISDIDGKVKINVSSVKNSKNVSFDEIADFLENANSKILKTSFLNIEKV